MLASRSAIESDSSANPGSRDSSGKSDVLSLGWWNPWLSRSEVRELGRRGVVGLEGGWVRDWEVGGLGLGPGPSIFGGVFVD